MPKKFRRTFKKKKNSDHKKIVKLQKLVAPLTTSMCEDSYRNYGTVPSVFVGQNNTITLDGLGHAWSLTSLAEGLGPQSRIADRVHFKAIDLRLMFDVNRAAVFARTNTNLMRFQIYKIRQMEGDEDNRELPLVKNVLSVSTALTYADILSFPAQQNNRDKTKNYQVVFDKMFHISPTAPEAHPAKLYTNNSKVEYIGTYNQLVLNIHIKVPAGLISTFDSASNNVASCNQNHYIAVLWNPQNNTDGGDDRVQWAYQVRSYYENLL